MTDFRATDRIRKAWNTSIQFFRQFRAQDSKGINQQPTAAVQATLTSTSAATNYKKPIILAGGIIAILAAVGIGGIQYVKANTNDYYHLYMNGTEVGTIGSPLEVGALLEQKASEAQQATPDIPIMVESGQLTYTSTSAYKGSPDTQQTLAKLEGLLTTHAVGVEVKVNGKVIGIVKSQAAADAVLARVQSKYAPEEKTEKESTKVRALAFSPEEVEVDKNTPKAGKELTDVAFVEKVETGAVSTSPSDIVSDTDMYKLLVEGTIKPTKYKVQQGDCVGCIAQKFDISPQVIYENNKGIEDDMIKVGDVLDLTVRQPELSVRTTEKLTEIVTIDPPTEVQKNDEMRVGESKLISAGVSGSKSLTYKIVKENGYLISEELVDQQVIKEAVPTVMMKGTKVILGEGTGVFSAPVSGYSVSSTFGTRWGRLHKGIDMTGGKTITAADNGIVIFAGTKNGYGNVVIIDHKNGYETLYGHLDSISVSVGDILEKGDTLGIMGNTGRSYGVHLHFEIHKDGELQNPLKYL
ncbi:M23 family metallopeptidase [Paenibacillus algorifonticola]|uniref:peptidoglycan DD-metalloendopeptidase family protein n=1 Tax=Paenibacillus algorifonticola TaxID=684063 RepID=UPI003D2A1ABE